MDIEGVEYDILDGFKQPDGIFAKENVRFCQLDIELHNPSWKPRAFHFGKFFQDFIRHTGYIPVYGERFIGMHNKVTLIDGSGYGECEKMFAFSKYF